MSSTSSAAGNGQAAGQQAAPQAWDGVERRKRPWRRRRAADGSRAGDAGGAGGGAGRLSGEGALTVALYEAAQASRSRYTQGRPGHGWECRQCGRRLSPAGAVAAELRGCPSCGARNVELRSRREEEGQLV